MSSDNEFERMIQRMTQTTNDEPKRSRTPQLFGGIFAASFISFLGGTIIMLLNMIVNSAYPNLGDFEPGIGYWNATRLFFLSWILFAIFNGLKKVQENS